MALLRNLCVNLRDFLSGLLEYASAQSLDLNRGIHAPRPRGQLESCPIPLSCGIVLDLAENSSFMNWKLKLVSFRVSGWTLARNQGVEPKESLREVPLYSPPLQP